MHTIKYQDPKYFSLQLLQDERTKSSSPFSQKENIPHNYNFSCTLSEALTLNVVFSLLLILNIWSLITAWLSLNFTSNKIITVVHIHSTYLKKTESYPPRQGKGTIKALTTWQANPWFNSENPIKMSCWYMLYEGTAVQCMNTMYMWLTNISSFWINSKCIGNSAGKVGIIKDLWSMKSVLVTNLIWVTRNPSESRWRVSFCFTIKSYPLLHTNKIISLKFNNLGCICTSIWKKKSDLKKQQKNK